MTAGATFGYAVLLVGTLLHVAVSTVLFVKRRSIFPMSGHCAELVAIIAVGISVHGALGAISGFLNGEIPCLVVVTASYLGVISYSTGVMVRAWRIWFYYQFATEKTNAIIDEQSRWFARHRHFFTSRHLFMFALVTIFIAWIGPVIAFVSVESDVFGALPLPGTTSHCASMVLSRVFLQTFSALSMCSLFVAIWKLRGISDGYRMKRDLMISVWTFLMGLSSTVLEPLIGATGTRVTLGILLNVMAFAVVTWKVILSYQIPKMREQAQVIRLKWKKKPTISRSSSSTSMSFKDVLKDSEMLKLFTEHLKREFSVENLLFYNRAREFENACATGHLQATERNIEAALVFADFISIDGDLQVNLDSKTFSEIKTELGRCIEDFNAKEFRSTHKLVSLHTVSSKVFDPAKRSIFRLMESDAFIRFKMSLWKDNPRSSRFEALARTNIVHTDSYPAQPTHAHSRSDSSISEYSSEGSGSGNRGLVVPRAISISAVLLEANRPLDEAEFRQLPYYQQASPSLSNAKTWDATYPSKPKSRDSDNDGNLDTSEPVLV